jgi:[ribosomal protein S18]-alanine N-acetyltransferase
MTTLASKPLQIRRGTHADLAAMLEIERASFSDPWSEESFTTALTLDRMLVLVADELDGERQGRDGVPSLAGYVVALVVGPDAEIADLAVAPSSRRRGVGQALMERAASELARRGVRSLYLEVRESNVGARTLYEANGFRPVGRRRGYYRQPVEDALLLKREIGPT